MFRVVVLLLLVVLVALGGYAVLQHSGDADVDQAGADQTEIQQGLDQVDSKHEGLQKRLDDAINEVEQGDESAGWEEVERLARVEPVFLPVHRFLVEHLIAENRDRRDGSVLGKLIHHLRIVAQSGDVEANVILGRLYIVMGQRQQGIETLRRVVDGRPEVNTLLVRALVAEGKKEEAEQLLESTIAKYRNQLASDPSSLKSRLGLVDNLTVSSRYEEATQVLREGLKQHPELLALTMESAIKHVDVIKDSQPATALNLLQRAAQDDSNDLALWSRVVALLDSDETAIAQRAQEFIEQSLRQENRNGNLDMVLGSHAYARDEFAKAIEYLENAHSLSPENPLVASTLANYLAKADPPELDRALKLVDNVLEDFPDRKAYYFTRGKTLSLLGRDDEAISDLQVALKAMPGNPEVVALLSDLLDDRGENAKAAALREMISQPLQGGNNSTPPSIDSLLDNTLKE
ncbi:MAG: tetratricopeptide repeat protein [Pirellulaceae bacterium]